MVENKGTIDLVGVGREKRQGHHFSFFFLPSFISGSVSSFLLDWRIRFPSSRLVWKIHSWKAKENRGRGEGEEKNSLCLTAEANCPRSLLLSDREKLHTQGKRMANCDGSLSIIEIHWLIFFFVFSSSSSSANLNIRQNSTPSPSSVYNSARSRDDLLDVYVFFLGFCFLFFFVSLFSSPLSSLTAMMMMMMIRNDDDDERPYSSRVKKKKCGLTLH